LINLREINLTAIEIATNDSFLSLMFHQTWFHVKSVLCCFYVIFWGRFAKRPCRSNRHVELWVHLVLVLWVLSNFSSTEWEKGKKYNLAQSRIAKELISRNFCQIIHMGANVTYTVEITEIPSHCKKKNSSNQLFSDFFSISGTFTKFLPKMSESKFP